MNDKSITKEDLITEISRLKQKINELELSEAEHLRALESLRRSEMKYRTLYDLTSDAVILMNRNIFDCNDAAIRIFGFTTREQLRGKHPADLSPPFQPCGTESRVLGDRHIAMALKDGMHQFEWIHKRADTGETFPADVLLSQMVIDGRMVLQAVIRDTTQRKRIEEALLKEIEFNSTLVESSPAFFVAINADRTIRLMNSSMLQALEYTLEELKNRDYMELIPESDREMLSGVFSTLIDRGRPTFNENRVLAKNGKIILVEWHGRAIKKPDGSLDYFFGVGTDITERKRAEESLRESEEKFRTVTDSTPTALMLYQDDRWIFVNNAAETLTGYSAKELLRMNFWDLVHPDFKGFVQERGRKRQQGEKAVKRYELKIITKNGAERWVGLTGASAMIGNRPAGVLSLADITDRKAAEEKLLESEARFRSYFELPLVGIAITSPEKGWVEINDRLCEMLGYSREELVRMTWSELTHPDDLAGDVEQFNRVLAGDIDNYSMDKRFIRKNGEIIWTSISVGSVRKLTREVDYMVALMQDITLRKEIEEALIKAHDDLELRVKERTAQLTEAYGSIQLEMEKREQAEEQLRQSHKMQAIGTLAGGIAHDFNNILAAILGFTEMAIEDVADRPAVENYLKKVLKSAARARDLVKQILAFSRKTNHERSPLSLSPLIRETLQLLRASIPVNIEIKLAMTAMPDTILAAPTEVQQIIMNLAANAALAMEEKGGILEIRLNDIDFMPNSSLFETETIPGEFVQLSVTDTGSGMSPDVMKRVFEPFYTTRALGEGTGMGLAVVYGIVTDLHGTITVESEPGIGSTFRVFLPKIGIQVRETYLPNQMVPTGTESILFLDDEDMLVEWAKIALGRLGYHVTALTDPAQALTLFSSDHSRFDLVIMDQSMPSMSGLQLAEEFLIIRPDIPIILCTGHSAAVSHEKAKKAGIKELLMKPLARQELAAAIRRAVDDV